MLKVRKLHRDSSSAERDQGHRRRIEQVGRANQFSQLFSLKMSFKARFFARQNLALDTSLDHKVFQKMTNWYREVCSLKDSFITLDWDLLERVKFVC